jgi:hypothetical protein
VAVSAAKERAMQHKHATQIALATVFFLAGAYLCPRADAKAAAMHNEAAQRFAREKSGAAPLMLAQNPFSAFSLPEMPEPPVSPINPGTLPGTSSAAGVTGTNPLTGRPCNGAGSLSISGAGGLPGTTSVPSGSSETIDQLPVGTPPFTSIYGSQSSLGAC